MKRLSIYAMRLQRMKDTIAIKGVLERKSNVGYSLGRLLRTAKLLLVAFASDGACDAQWRAPTDGAPTGSVANERQTPCGANFPMQRMNYKSRTTQ